MGSAVRVAELNAGPKIPLVGLGTSSINQNPEEIKTAVATALEVILRWGLEQGVSVLPKSYNKGRITQNFQVFDWSLTAEDHSKISRLEQKKTITGHEAVNSTTSPYKSVEELWDGEI